MFRNIQTMTMEEIKTELDDLKQIQILSQQVDVDNMLNTKYDLSPLKKYNITITPNGEIFTTTKQGFLAEMMETMYNDRTKYKKKSIEARKDLEQVLDEINRRKKK
jgi:uncharacterized lipoprotein YajG